MKRTSPMRSPRSEITATTTAAGHSERASTFSTSTTIKSQKERSLRRQILKTKIEEMQLLNALVKEQITAKRMLLTLSLPRMILESCNLLLFCVMQ